MPSTISLFGSPSGIFPSQTETAQFNNVVKSSTNISDTDLSDGDGSEVIFELVNRFHDAIQSGDATKVVSNSSQTLNGAVLTKTYNFVFQVDLETDAINLNVSDE